MMGFKNKTVWVTGASSGIGKALAIQFSKLGANVVLSSRKESDLKEVEKLCQANTFVLPLDLSFQDNFNELVKKVYDQFGQIDILINNGGISQRSLASETTLEVDRKLMEVNYFGTVGLTKAVLPVMLFKIFNNQFTIFKRPPEERYKSTRKAGRVRRVYYQAGYK